MRSTKQELKPSVGIYGYLAVFFWSLGMIVFSPPEQITPVAALCLFVVAFFYPQKSTHFSMQRFIRPRWLLWIGLLVIPPIFFWGTPDRTFWGLAFSTQGLLLSMRIALEIIVILAAVNMLTSAVDITSLAGLIERLGLKGLGFAIGVALNLLPALRQSSINAWRSLWMRGGFRKKRWRGLQMLSVTIMTNALRWAEEVSLAAESRAFSPDNARALPVKSGSLDALIIIIGLVSFLCFVLVL
jgi:energy-coupling factor transporter transmembrane protein EcfT